MLKNVLVVDDDPVMHQLYRPHIERGGYRMLSAATGEEAIDLSVRESPEVVVMDIGLPGLNGLSALHEMRKLRGSKPLPAIVISSAPEYDVCEQEVNRLAGARFLPKPFGPGQLLTAIREIEKSGL